MKIGLIATLWGITGSIAAPTSTSAIPSTTSSSSSTTDTAICKTLPDLASSAQGYEVQVSRSFIDGLGCEPIKATITEKVGNVTDWHCDEGTADISLKTVLRFAVGGMNNTVDNTKLIEALQEAYPTVPFQENGICKIDSTESSEQTPVASTSSAVSITSTISSTPTATGLTANAVSCYSHWDLNSTTQYYHVIIGVPLNDRVGCDPIKEAIERNAAPPQDWHCDANGQYDNNTLLSFKAGPNNDTSANEKVIQVLQNSYPMVDAGKFQACSIEEQTPQDSSSPTAFMGFNTANCHTGYDAKTDQRFYNTTVGRPYLNKSGRGCEKIFSIIGDMSTVPTEWHCDPSFNGTNTVISFVVGHAKDIDMNGKVVAALRKAYYTVKPEGFNGCETPIKRRRG